MMLTGVKDADLWGCYEIGSEEYVGGRRRYLWKISFSERKIFKIPMIMLP